MDICSLILFLNQCSQQCLFFYIYSTREQGTMTSVGRSEDSLQELVFFSHHMSLGDQTQVFGLSGMHLYQLSLLSDPQYLFLKAYDFV